MLTSKIKRIPFKRDKEKKLIPEIFELQIK